MVIASRGTSSRFDAVGAELARRIEEIGIGKLQPERRRVIGGWIASLAPLLYAESQRMTAHELEIARCARAILNDAFADLGAHEGSPLSLDDFDSWRAYSADILDAVTRRGTINADTFFRYRAHPDRARSEGCHSCGRLVHHPEWVYGEDGRPYCSTACRAAARAPSSPAPSPKRRISFAAARIAAAGLLLFALASHPYSYYEALRIIVCGVSGWSIVEAWRLHSERWEWAFGILAVLFNPVVPVALSREVWSMVDVVAAILFLASLRQLRPALVAPAAQFGS